jgi:hypothetical protein
MLSFQPVTITPLITSREPISKKLRFEVFKRDSFRCQYCGASAPEAILEVDHVTPVVDGGKSDILNLITSCKPCNSGKGKRPLSDKTAITKQLDQLKELNERREQLEMLIQWKEELSNLKEESASRIGEYWSKHVPGFSLTEQGMRDLKKLMNQFEFQEILEAISIAADQYLKHDKKGNLEADSVNLAFSKLRGICRTRRLEKKKPYIRDLYYVRAVLRNRGYVNEQYVMELLESAVKAGIDVEDLKQYAKQSSSWSRFRDDLESRIEQAWGG